MPYFVYSTLASGNDYTEYKTDGNINTPVRVVKIAGGAGVASRIQALAGESLTPPGAVTEVTDEEMAFLKTNEVFKLHESKGYIRVVQKLGFGKGAAVAKVARDMKNDDPSRPITEDDMKKGGRLQGAKLHSIGAVAE